MRLYGTAELIHGTWLIHADPHVAMRMKRLMKRSDADKPGFLRIEHSLEVAADLEWFMQRYPMEVKPSRGFLIDAAAAFHERILRLEEFMSADYVPRPFAMAVPPRTYQAREAEIVLQHGFCLIADEVGLGKTITALAVLSDARTRPAVIVVPTHLQSQWSEMVGRFLPDATTHIVQKLSPYPLPAKADVIIVPYSKLRGWSEVLATKSKAVVFDEVQALRTGSSMLGVAAVQLARACDFRVGLSATPIYNYGGEIFNILDTLKEGVLGSVMEFHREWCVPLGNGKYAIKDPRAFGAWARQSFAMVRHTRIEVGRELPDVVKIPHTVDSDRKGLDAIEDRVRELAQIILGGSTRRGEKMQAAEELSNMMRQETGIAKAPYVADFVRMLVESGERVVLCGWHRAVYEIWQSKLADLGVEMYTGSESPTQKAAAVARFIAGERSVVIPGHGYGDRTAKEDVKILILSLRAGEGLNELQTASSCIVFGELDWSPGVHEQCIGRLQRDGQPNKVVAYFLIANEGSDPEIAQVLGIKRVQIEGIRDPNAPLVETLDASGPDRIKRLARTFLERRGVELPTEVQSDRN